jgi:hypothetical protein
MVASNDSQDHAPLVSSNVEVDRLLPSHQTARMSAELPEGETLSNPQLPAQRPPKSKPAGIASPTIISLHSAGWLLLLCLFLPVCKSCNGTVERPIDALVVSSPMSTADILYCVTLLSVYGNGVLVAVLLTISAWLLSPVLWWRTFLVQFALTMTIGSVIVGKSVTEATGSDRLEAVLTFAPPLLAGGLWIGSAIRRRAQEIAWARLQHTWTIGAFLHLQLLCIFNVELLSGYWLTLAALAGMVFAVELGRHRLQHDLWDANRPASRPQFTLRKVFWWMTFFPLVFGYYQSIEPFAKWLYGEP